MIVYHRVVPPGHWCPPLLVLITVGALKAMGVPLFIPWCPAQPLVLPSHRGGCVMAMWCPLLILVIVGAPPPQSSWLCGGPPAHHRGSVVSPWLSSWSWCPSLLVLITMGASHSSSRVWVHMCMVSALLLNPHPLVVVVVVVLWW